MLLCASRLCVEERRGEAVLRRVQRTPTTLVSSFAGGKHENQNQTSKSLTPQKTRGKKPVRRWVHSQPFPIFWGVRGFDVLTSANAHSHCKGRRTKELNNAIDFEVTTSQGQQWF